MEINNIDKSDMRQVILDLPKQLEEKLVCSIPIPKDRAIENIVICGIGGSTLPGDLLKTWLDAERRAFIPVVVHKDYNLPLEAQSKSLIICISYSGNTEEALSAIQEAIERKLNIVGISSGGKLQAICAEHNIPWVKIPSGIQPRSALAYQFSAVSKILADIDLLENQVQALTQTAQEIRSITESYEQKGKTLAQELIGKILVVYASATFRSLAYIWKIKFNENAKNPAFYNFFPEVNHNEMVGMSNSEQCRNFHIILLEDQNDHPRNLKRMRLFAELMREKQTGVSTIEIPAGTVLFKIFATSFLGDWTSYYLALARNIDPTPIELVEEFKKKME